MRAGVLGCSPSNAVAFYPFGDLLGLAASLRITDLAEILGVFRFQSHRNSLPWL